MHHPTLPIMLSSVYLLDLPGKNPVRNIYASHATTASDLTKLLAWCKLTMMFQSEVPQNSLCVEAWD